MNDVSTVVQHTKQVLPEHKSQFMLVLLVEFTVLFTIRCVEFEIALQFMCMFFEDSILLEYYTLLEGVYFPTFQRTVMPSILGALHTQQHTESSATWL